MTADPAARPYEIVIYGASGFVGRQAAAYLRAHAPAGLRWAVAGRDRDRLAAVSAGADVLVADSHDRPAIDALAARTRVVLNTAGPFAKYGDAVVDACVRHRVHYVDITGEVLWVRGLIDRHHARAAADGTRIVPFCGFDSIPSDLGTLLAVRQLQRAGHAACREAKSYFQMRGGFNGGTMASMFHGIESGGADPTGDPFALSPPEARPPDGDASRDVTDVAYDAAVGAWVGPFMMGRINTRVVRRSAALFAAWGEPYGPRTRYQEYARYRRRVTAVLVGAGMTAFQAGLARAPTRALLKRVLPRPGTGPSEKTMDEGFFRCETIALAEDGAQARVVMHHRGDPGNRATTRFVCESALCLLLEEPRLPRRGGVLTPATAFGEVLADRLRAAGVSITG